MAMGMGMGMKRGMVVSFEESIGGQPEEAVGGGYRDKETWWIACNHVSLL